MTTKRASSGERDDARSKCQRQNRQTSSALEGFDSTKDVTSVDEVNNSNSEKPEVTPQTLAASAPVAGPKEESFYHEANNMNSMANELFVAPSSMTVSTNEASGESSTNEFNAAEPKSTTLDPRLDAALDGFSRWQIDLLTAYIKHGVARRRFDEAIYNAKNALRNCQDGQCPPSAIGEFFDARTQFVDCERELDGLRCLGEYHAKGISTAFAKGSIMRETDSGQSFLKEEIRKLKDSIEDEQLQRGVKDYESRVDHESLQQEIQGLKEKVRNLEDFCENERRQREDEDREPRVSHESLKHELQALKASSEKEKQHMIDLRREFHALSSRIDKKGKNTRDSELITKDFVASHVQGTISEATRKACNNELHQVMALEATRIKDSNQQAIKEHVRRLKAVESSMRTVHKALEPFGRKDGQGNSAVDEDL